MKLPTFFLSHDAPTLAVEETDETRAWAKLAAELPRPREILAVSAHWDTDMPMVSTASKTLRASLAGPLRRAASTIARGCRSNGCIRLPTSR